MGRNIEADYLVVGAGAMGLAFADTLVSESDATVVVVDRNDQPGGHWTTAYPFVRLHQPSAYYGVNSRNLGTDTIDQSGLNAGYYELASGAEVCAYFDTVMRQHLLPTGRVTYLPMSEYLGGGQIRTLGGEDMSVFLDRVPGCFFFVGSAPAGGHHPHHSPDFDIDERALALGTVLFEAVALKAAQRL